MLVPISLVITVYNRERYLGAAIESVLAQTRGDLELVVWDDGSTDRSVEIAQNYARQDARVRVVAAQHQGRGRALKDAIAQTTGTYLGLVDSDDILAPTALEETAAILDTHPATGLVYTDYLVMNEHGAVKGYGSRCRLPYSPMGLLRKFMTFHFRLMRRTVFDEVGGSDESFYVSEDYELCLRLSEVTHVQRVSKPLYYYRVHRESITQQQKAEQNRLALIAIKQARKRRQRADNFPVTLLNRADFSTQPSQNLYIAPLVQTGLIHSLQTRQGINSTASSQSRFQPTARDRAILVHFNGLDLLVRSLNSGRVSGMGKRFIQSLAKNLSHALAALPLIGAISVTPALAQIVPAADGTNTLVNTTGNQLDITGGQTSSNGANLFHSFSQFDVNTGQTANFQSNPTIQNILGRVVSGNASNINGLIQVSGSQANLYLMNPAGMIFGSNASLNVPASFVATTATSIGIGNNWFNAAGSNDYTQLNGTPNAFAFTTSQPGSIVNSGNLAVGAGKDLMLLGGTVVSTGQLNAPAGKITIAAVPGTSLVRLSQPGMVLSLEVLPPASGSSSPTQWTLPILSLPQLLTGGGGGNATGISVNANGEAVLTGSGVLVPSDPGTTMISGTVNASSIAPNQTSGEVNILGDKVGLVSANIDASGTNSGGTVLIGGDYQGKGTVPNASRTYVSSDSVINADSLVNGNGGRVIVWANNLTGFYGNISARGGSNSGNGGFVEVSGKENLAFHGQVNAAATNGLNGTILFDPRNITIVAGTGADDNQLNADVPTAGDAAGAILSGDGGAVDFTISNTVLESQLGNVILEATNDITIADGLSLNFYNAIPRSITFTADADGDGVGSFSMDTTQSIFAGERAGASAGGNKVTISGASVTVGSITTSGGAINITATNGNIITVDLDSFSGPTRYGLDASNGGAIILSSPNGSITTSNLSSGSGSYPRTASNGGAITFFAGNGINITGNLNSSSSGYLGAENGGAIILSTANGNIATGNLNSSSATAFGNAGNGGNITLTAANGNITLGSDINTSTSTGSGGSISFTGNVTLAQPTTTLTTSGTANSGNLTFNSQLNGTTTGAQNLSLNSGTGTITFNGIGNSVLLGNIAINGTGNIQMAGDYTFLNSNTFNNPVNLFGNTTINAENTIAFNNTLTAGANNLTLNANEINFAGLVSGTGNLTLQPFTSSQNIALAGDTDSGTGILDITTADITAWQNGFNSITIGGANSSGAINILNPVTFFDPVTIQAPEGAGTINATGAITGLDNASITLKANQNITTSNITANPGITLISSNGTIDTSSGILDSSSNIGNGGVISLSALGNIATNNLTSHSDSGAGGDITLNSQTGAISSGNLDASGNTRGGNITVMAKNQITAGQINSSAITGDGGNVLLDPIGDIQVDLINAQGGTSGKGGNVDITTNQFFRAVGNFSDRNGINASISTAGGTGSGDIIIRHDGGARDIPFNVGDATINGTAGAITTGSANSILSFQSFPGAYTQGNIQIITQNPPPPPQPPTLPLPSPIPSPSPKPDTNRVPKDIQGENFVPQGINTISASAIVLLNTTDIVREDIDQAIASGQIEKASALVEQLRMQEFQDYFEGNLTSDTGESGSVEQTQAVLSDIATNTGKTPAVIYVFTQPDQLQLILVTPKDKPLLKTVYQANRDTLLKTAAKFRSQVTEPRNKTGYQATAKQLYQWLVEPLEAELQAKKIDTLVFSMDGGLRSIPMAALYDGKNFLVEKYSIGLIPSINLTDTRYGDVKTTEVLAMGASKFTEQDPLPAVPTELSTLVGKQNLAAENRELLPANQFFSQGLWTGKSFLNQGFTLANLKAQREQTPFGVIHLATHGEFNLGTPRNSYIQLSDSKLRLDQLRQMGWNNPPVELLVLSACRTALGNEDAEFGFGGLAVAAGVKSAIASLWYVSDEGTLGLITEFYQQLKTAPIKAEALRQAQMAMIKGQVRLEGGQLQGIGQGSSIPLPPELAEVGDKEFSHPYYWSAFTMIGSPW
jgi:filamentous hemagglutinin family protein